MNLSKDELNHFDNNSEYKQNNYKSFSFDLNKVVKQLNKDGAIDNQDSDEKDKIIIKEPLEVFEIENASSISTLQPNKQDTQYDDNSKNHEENEILSRFQNNDLMLNEIDSSKATSEFHERIFSPKFMSVKQEDEIENILETQESTHNKEANDLEEDKIQDFALKVSPDKNSRLTKSRESNDFEFPSPASSNNTDYKEKLRQSLETGSKRLSKNNDDENSDDHILSPEDSRDSLIKPHDYQLSPLHEKYANIDELKSSTLKKQEEMMHEIDSIRNQELDIVNQLLNN